LEGPLAIGSLDGNEFGTIPKTFSERLEAALAPWGTTRNFYWSPAPLAAGPGTAFLPKPRGTGIKSAQGSPGGPKPPVIPLAGTLGKESMAPGPKPETSVTPPETV